MNLERLLTVLVEPHTSEKTTLLADKFKKYAFKVNCTATKQEIKKAVEQLFNVKVEGVSVINIQGKRKRFKQLNGQRKDWKKAYVTLQESYDINFSVAE